MGVKNWSKTFKHKDVFTDSFVKIKNKTIAIDAMTELYRAALGAKNVKTLTDTTGNPTLHINVCISNIIKMHSQGITQIWVFDHDAKGGENAPHHNPAKIIELKKRSEKKQEAKKKLSKLDELFGESDDEDEDIQTAELKKNSLEKQAFTITSTEINELKLILNCLNIQYVEAPKGYEAEHIAALMNAEGIVDGVYSGDTDPIAFGALTLYRKNPRDKKIYTYTREDVLKQIEKGNSDVEQATLEHLRKICMILGTDFAEKTPGVGPKTVIKKFLDIDLTKEQKKGMAEFSKFPDNIDVDFFNAEKTPFVHSHYNQLIEWLVLVKNFNRGRMEKLFKKVINED